MRYRTPGDEDAEITPTQSAMLLVCARRMLQIWDPRVERITGHRYRLVFTSHLADDVLVNFLILVIPRP